MNLFDIKGKKAIVTGGSRGLGYGMAEGLMEAGCETVIIGVSDRVFRTAQEFRERGLSCQAVRADLGDREEMEPCFKKAVELLGGRLDILVTAHGIQSRHRSEEFPLEDWSRVLYAFFFRRLYRSCLCSVKGRGCTADQGTLQ